MEREDVSLLGPQAERILRALERGEHLTSNDALFSYGVGRLAARVGELRAAGYPVVSRLYQRVNTWGDVSRLAVYCLDPEAEA